MAIFNYKTKEIIGKIVYYGPGLGGKTTSLQYLHQSVVPERRGELYFLATEADQTIYFELLPLRVGEIQDFKLRFQVYTVPGQVKYNNTRRAVLQGADAVVFVADSQSSRRKANILSFENLRSNLAEYNLRLKDVPLVYAYNKRDLAPILTVEALNQDVNPLNLPYFETIATEGKGVLEAFELISALAIQKIEERLRQPKVEDPAVAQAPSGEIPAASKGAAPRSDQDFSGYLSGDDEEAYLGSNKEIDLLDLPSSDKTPGSREKEKSLLSLEEEKGLSYSDLFAITYRDGEIIFEKGDPGSEMYFIEEGAVEIVQFVELKKKVLVTYKKGDFFGEMVLFDDKPRSATAVARGTTRLFAVTKETLNSQVQKKPEITQALLKALSARIRGSNQAISKLTEKNKELTQRLNLAYAVIKRLMRENKLLKQGSDPENLP